jgi:hypothetical protein
MANFFYNRAARKIADGTIALSTDTLKVMLVTSVYTPNRDHDFVDAGGASDPIDAELSGTGYVGGLGGAGRKTLTTKTFSEDDANDRGEMDCDDITWTAINAGTAAAAIVIREGGSDAASELIAYIDSGFPKTTNGGDLTLQINAEGLFWFQTT